MFNYENYDVEKIIYESNFQRILLCKNEDNELFYNNIILRERLIELIDKEFYPNNSDNLIAIEETEDRLYIYSKYIELEKLTEFINNNDLTYRKRVEITENLLEKFEELEKYSDIQVKSMMTEDNILIDEKNNIVFKNLLVFDQDYDIEESILIKNISNYIHYIFAGEFIKEFNISEVVPPDIRKIIIRASSTEYASIRELINSFKKSPTYTLILPLNKSDEMKVTTEMSEDTLEKTENKDKKKKYLIPIIIAVILIPLIIMFLLNNKDEPKGVNSEQENPENQTPNEQVIPEESQDENNTMPETILSFYNEEVIKENSEDYAKIDFSEFYDGYYSLKIENTENENKKYLFAIVDLNDDEYSYLKNREVGISTRFTSNKAMEGNWIIEVRKNGEISNITNEKTIINPNTWIIKQRSLTLGDNDEIKLFFQYDGNATIWIDSIEIDVLK